MTHLAVHCAAAFLAGAVLGGAYFWGLWATIQHSLDARRPAVLLLFSAVLRIGLLLLAFWWLGVAASPEHQWQRLGACLLGFLLARWIAARWLTPQAAASEARP